MTAVLTLATVTGCGRESRATESSTPRARAGDFAAMLRERVSTDAMMAHLSKLQEIADANDGNRDGHTRLCGQRGLRC